MIEVHGLTKRYGAAVAVDDLSFRVRPGYVTGFLGPNGSGKSTTMRMILGLAAPNAGSATVNGSPYRMLPAPLQHVGALLDPDAAHGGRTAANHLLWLAQSNGIARHRVGDVIDMVGLGTVANRRTKGFSLGMRQRLGIAAALLGDPGVLILDEPVNGLDTDGIRWFRQLLRSLASEGRTILLSSHVMSEMALVADHLIVIGHGHLVADTSMRDFIERNSTGHSIVRTPDIDRLAGVLRPRGARLDSEGSGAWRVSGIDAATVGDLATEHRITLHELTPTFASLEDVYVRLTASDVEFRSTQPVEISS